MEMWTKYNISVSEFLTPILKAYINGEIKCMFFFEMPYAQPLYP